MLKTKTFLMIDGHEGYGQLAYGYNPFDAAKKHYDELDMWCSPSDDLEFHNEFSVHLYEVPEKYENAASERFSELDGDEFMKQLSDFFAETGPLVGTTVNVVCDSTDGVDVSPQDLSTFHQTDLFDSITKH